MIGKHVVIDTLDNFKTKLSQIPSSAIVLIKDVGQIYAHGTYFGAQKTYSLLTKTADGLAPKGGTSASSQIKDGETEWVLTVTNGENPSWRRLPDNAFNSLQYTLPAATTTELGGIKVGKQYTATFSDLVGKYYKINIDKDGLAYVEVPWTDNDCRVEQVNTSVLDEDFRVTFSGTATNDTKTETLRKSSKLLFNPVSGKLTSTTFEGNLDGNYINKLTGYAIAKQESAISVNDSLNQALGKLEYKLDSAYNWYKGISETDDDSVINKWTEIVDFVDSITEGTDIITKFVTTDTDQNITGTKTFTSKIIIQGISNSKIILNNTEEEESKIQGISFQQNGVEYGILQTLGSSDLRWNANKIWHEGNDGSGSGLDADFLDGFNLRSQDTPWGAIPLIRTDGVTELGMCIDFHYDNTAASDYSTRLWASGNHSNAVQLPSKSGILALTTSDITGNAATASALKTPITLKIGDTGKSFDGSQSLTWNASDIGYKYSWVATIKGYTWSRLCFVKYETKVTGSSYILNIKGTRTSVVYNNTYLVNTHHGYGRGHVVQLGGSNYGNTQTLKVRICTDDSGSSYFEVFDSIRQADSSVTQSVSCYLIPISCGVIDRYTLFTSGENIDQGFEAGEVLNSSNYSNSISASNFVGNLIGNSDTTTKLKNSIKLWGNDFDGSSDINGNIILPNGYTLLSKDSTGNARQLVALNSVNQFGLGYGTSIAGYDTNIYGNNVHIRYGTSGQTGITVTSSGFVGIGTVNPNRSLTVNGSVHIDKSSNLYFRASSTIPNDPGDLVFENYEGNEIGRIFKDEKQDAFKVRFGPSGSDIYTILHTGNLLTELLKVDGHESGIDADTVDGMHVNTNPMGKTYGKIPLISSEAGVMEIGRYIDFHSDNTTSLDYSTRIQSEGNNGNVLKLPTTSGTLALTTDSMQSINVQQDIESNSEYPIIWSNSKNSDSESTKLYKSYDYLTYNPNQKILSSTYFKGYLTSSVPSNIKHSLVYTSGIYKSPKAFEGSSPDYSVLSYPKGGTYINSDGNLNIINLRFMWNNQYWHDIFISPNKTYLYHRHNNSTTEGKPWARIVEESSSEIWDIISKNSTKLGGYESTRFVRKEVLNTNYNFDANSLNTDCMIYTSTGDLLGKAPKWDNFPYSVQPQGGFSLFTIHEGSYQRQLFGQYNDSHLYTRTQHYDSTTGKPGWKYWETIALLSDIPTIIKEYYWADVNISKTPNSNTTPTFAKVTSKQFYYNQTVDSQDPIFYVGSDNKDVTLFRVYSSGAEDTGYLASHGYSLMYTGSQSDSNNKLQLLADNGSSTKQIIALSINNTGQVGIKTDADQSYSLKVEGKIRSDNEVIVNNPNAFRIIYGDYGVIQRIDTSNYFLLLTNKGDTLGSFNTLRPFTMNLEKGTISIANLESSNNIYAKGFNKTNSNDTYVLLGGGGHKSLSDFTLANTTTFDKTLEVTQDWMDTGIKHDDLTTGTYVVQVYVNAQDSTGYMYDCYWSGIMSWYSRKVYTKTNDDETDEILLHRSGHAYNNTIYLRTIMSVSSDTNQGLRLQIAANKDIAKQYSYKFTFKKMI